MYQNYLFDLYGTLVDIHTDEEKEELWERLSMFYGYYGAAYKPAELKKKYYEFVSIDEAKLKIDEQMLKELFINVNVLP